MSSPQGYLRTRTPQACERCRRSKTKCNGDRPRCRACLKRNVTCSWTQTAPPNTSYAIAPLQKNDLDPKSQHHQAIPDVISLVKTPLIVLEPHLLQRLFRVFFDRHHDSEFCSFFHKPTLDIPTLHTRAPLLVASVISLSALYVTDEEAKTDFGFETSSELSDHYARVAKFYAYGLYDEPSIYNIQSYLILSIRELITWSNIKAYMYAGTAIRMAQALHLNLEVTQQCSSQQREIRRRTFWACCIVDRLISYSCNKPFTISSQSIHIHLPCPENVFIFGEVHTGFTLEDLALQTNQVSQLGIIPFFIAMVQLWGDMASLHVCGGRRQSKVGPHTLESEFRQYERAIEDFSSNLPPSLSWSEQNYKLHEAAGQAQVYVNLNFLLHHSRCVMHQEYLPELDSQYSLDLGVEDETTYDAAGMSLDYNDFSIIKPCISSTNTITDMVLKLNTGSERDRELLQSISAANAILTASAVHLWVLYTQTCDDCPKHIALARAEELRRIIKSWKPQWRVATAWVETLEMLYKLYVYSYGKIVDSDLDCWDIETDGIGDNLGDAADEGDGHQATSDADGMPDPSKACQRLHDKIRSILVNPLLATDAKKRNLRIYCKTLWKHMWIFGPTEGVDDFLNLETILGGTGSELLDLPSLI